MSPAAMPVPESPASGRLSVRWPFGLRTAVRALASRVTARSIGTFGCAVGWVAVVRIWPCGHCQLCRHERRSIAPIGSRRAGGRWRRQPRGCHRKRDARPARGVAQRAVGLVNGFVNDGIQRRVNVRSARRRQELAHQWRWRRQRSRRSRCPPAASRSPRWPPPGRQRYGCQNVNVSSWMSASSTPSSCRARRTDAVMPGGPHR